MTEDARTAAAPRAPHDLRLAGPSGGLRLAPIEAERVSEAAGVNPAAGSSGLAFGLAVGGGLLLAAPALSITQKSGGSTVIPARVVSSFRMARLPEITPSASIEEITPG